MSLRALGGTGVFVKICGCRRPEDIQAAVAAGVDAVGWILAPGRRRSVGPAQARVLRQQVPAGVWAVGVCVDQPLAEVLAAVRELRLDAVQLHGREPDPYAAQVRRLCPVIRAWDLQGAIPAELDVLLLDAAGGGSGQAWDWSRAHLPAPPGPVLLAGGLTPENVAEACAAARPWGVDVSSGVEVGGRKDPGRIDAFCGAVRRWEAQQAAGMAEDRGR